MKTAFFRVLESQHFHLAGLWAVALALAMTAGCASTDAAKTVTPPTAATAQPAPTVVAASAPVTPHEAESTKVSNCAAAIKEIAISKDGDPISKVVAAGAIERLCNGNGGGGAAVLAMLQAQQAAPSAYREPECSGFASCGYAFLRGTASFARDLFHELAPALPGYFGWRSNQTNGEVLKFQSAEATKQEGLRQGTLQGAFASNVAIANGKPPGQVYNLTNSNGNSFGTGNVTWQPVTDSNNPVNPNPKQCFPTYAAGQISGYMCF